MIQGVREDRPGTETRVKEGRLLVLGVGNVLCSDDGVGPAVVERLASGWEAPPGVTLMDGGAGGVALAGLLGDAGDVLVVDAVEVPGLAPGTLVRVEAEAVEASADGISLHEAGVADLLGALRLLEQTPPRVTLLGVVPASLEVGLDRTPAVAGALGALVDAVVEAAAELGFTFRPRGGDPRPKGALPS
jgi:hydrogenase maturation protease